MTDKELASRLFKSSKFQKVNILGEFIEQNINDEKQCYARLFRKGYNELNRSEIEECIRLLLNSGNRDLILKSIKYIKNEYFYLIEEAISKFTSSDIFEILRNVNSDRIRLLIIDMFKDNDEIVISAIKRMEDKNLLPDWAVIKFRKYTLEFLGTVPSKEYDGERIL